jgi:hypothetical protein
MTAGLRLVVSIIVLAVTATLAGCGGSEPPAETGTDSSGIASTQIKGHDRSTYQDPPNSARQTLSRGSPRSDGGDRTNIPSNRIQHGTTSTPRSAASRRDTHNGEASKAGMSSGHDSDPHDDNLTGNADKPSPSAPTNSEPHNSAPGSSAPGSSAPGSSAPNNSRPNSNAPNSAPSNSGPSIHDDHLDDKSDEPAATIEVKLYDPEFALDCASAQTCLTQFGTVLLGRARTIAFVVTVPRPGITITRISIDAGTIISSDTNAHDFRLDPGSCTPGTHFDGNSTCTLHIMFAPTAQGIHRARLVIEHAPGKVTFHYLVGQALSGPSSPTRGSSPSQPPMNQPTRSPS